MPIYLLEGTATDVSTMENVLAFIKSIWTAMITLAGSLYTTITETPLVFIAVIISFAGGLILFALSVLRRLGVGSGGRRRRGRR